MGEGGGATTQAAGNVATPRRSHGRALFLFGLALAILAVVYASYSRLAVLELMIEALKGLDLQWPPAGFDVEAEKQRLKDA